MAPPPLRKTVYVGNFVHTPRCGGGLEVLEKHAIAVDERGVIRAVQAVEEVGEVGRDPLKARVAAGIGWRGEECDVEFIGAWEDEEEDVMEWVAPGFVDTHTHAPQLPNLALFGSSTLLSWLRTYTFPLESSLSSLSTAHRIYSCCIASHLRHGTTTAAYYATIHVPATNLLASLAHAAGQRAFIGRVCMDRKGVNEDYYRDDTPETALQHTQATIAHCESLEPSPHGHEHGLVQPILTPRFAPSCTERMLSLLGTLAREHHPALRVQTHIAENRAELALVKDLFPAQRDYASVYDRFGLLTPRTVLAHAIHLSDAEVKLIKDRGAGVAHCPVSNTALASGICPVRKLLDRGVKVGLGTDVSGGCSCSILVAMREACG
ncbi:MAG: hypothetical protein Q9167_004775, partial [Letrouitia subvulpina]